MRSDLLLQLAAALEAPMPAGFTFNMREWLRPRYVRDLPCGFAGCAVGLGSTLPGWEQLEIEVTGLPLIFKDGEPLRHYAAVAAHLEIEIEQAEYLFSPHSYCLEPGEQISPLDVASRIRAFVATGVIEQTEDVAP
jgi:hypothetical protein